MKTIIWNVLAVVAGLVVGSVANMSLVMIGHAVFPPPPGVDFANMESVKAGAYLLEAKHFVFPFLAHAAGALVGAFIASFIGASHRLILSMIIGGLFLIGGISVAFMIPAPAWFIAADLLIAYIPMAWLGWKLSGKEK